MPSVETREKKYGDPCDEKERERHEVPRVQLDAREFEVAESERRPERKPENTRVADE